MRSAKLLLVLATAASIAAGCVVRRTHVTSPGGLSATASVLPDLAISADGLTSATVSVSTTRDEQPVAGEVVTFTAVPAAGVVLGATTVTTTSQGIAAVAITSRTPGPKLVEITVMDPHTQELLDLSIAVDFAPAPAPILALAASPTANVVADGTTTSTVTFSVTRPGSATPAGLPVSFAVSGATLSATTGSTDGNGRFTATIRSASAGTKTITATLTDAATNAAPTAQATVAFVAGAATANSTIAVTPTSVVADGTSTSAVKVVALDAQLNPVAGRGVTFAATGTGVLATATATTAADGSASTTITCADVSTVTVTASIDAGNSVTIPLKASIDFTLGPPSGHSTISAAPSSVLADASTPASITVVALDAENRPLPGIGLSFVATGNGNVLPTGGSADANGSFTTSLTCGDVGPVTVTATIDDGNGNTAVLHTTITFVVGAPSGNSTMAVSPASVVADGTSSSTISVVAIDASNHPVPGASVTFDEPSGNGVFSSTTATTGADGSASVTVTCLTVETMDVSSHIDAGGGTTIDQDMNVDFTVGPVASVVVSLDPNVANNTSTTVPADNSTAISFVVDVTDAQGRPLQGISLSVGLLSSVSGMNLTASNTTTDSNGEVFGSVVSSAATTNSIVATAPNTIAGSLDIGFTPGQGDNCNGNTSYFFLQSSATANGSDSCRIQISIADQFGNLVADGTTVTFNTSANLPGFTAPTSFQTTGGNATIAITSTVAEEVDFSIDTGFSNGQCSLQSGSVQFFAGDPDHFRVVGGGPAVLIGVAGVPMANPITVTIVDANDNPITSGNGFFGGGQPVTFTAVSGGAVLSSGSTETDQNGEASVIVAPGPGLNSVEVSVPALLGQPIFALRGVNGPTTLTFSILGSVGTPVASANWNADKVQTFTDNFTEPQTFQSTTFLEFAEDLNDVIVADPKHQQVRMYEGRDGTGTLALRETIDLSAPQPLPFGHLGPRITVNAPSSRPLGVAPLLLTNNQTAAGFQVGTTTPFAGPSITEPNGLAVADFGNDTLTIYTSQFSQTLADEPQAFPDQDVNTIFLDGEPTSIATSIMGGYWATFFSFNQSSGPFAGAVALDGGSQFGIVAALPDADEVAVIGTDQFGSASQVGAIDLSSGAEPVAVATSDFEFDGKLDVAVVSIGDETVSAYSGNGDGTFNFDTSVSLPGGRPCAIGAGRLGSPLIDAPIYNFLAVACPGDNTLRILIDDGEEDGNFTLAATMQLSAPPIAVYVSDVTSTRLELDALWNNSINVDLADPTAFMDDIIVVQAGTSELVVLEQVPTGGSYAATLDPGVGFGFRPIVGSFVPRSSGFDGRQPIGLASPSPLAGGLDPSGPDDLLSGFYHYTQNPGGRTFTTHEFTADLGVATFDFGAPSVLLGVPKDPVVLSELPQSQPVAAQKP